MTFATYEKVHGISLTVLKRSGRREPFSISKLHNSLETALRKRLPSPNEMEKILWEIEREIRRLGSIEVETTRIHALCAGALRKLDKVAYTRYTAASDAIVRITSSPAPEISKQKTPEIQLRFPLNEEVAGGRSPFFINP